MLDLLLKVLCSENQEQEQNSWQMQFGNLKRNKMQKTFFFNAAETDIADLKQKNNTDLFSSR